MHLHFIQAINYIK